MNLRSRGGFGSTNRIMLTSAPRHGVGGQVIGALGQAEADLAAKLTEALIAADAIGLTGIGIRLDQALVELTGLGMPIGGVGDDAPGH